jgi:hypothetical protein
MILFIEIPIASVVDILLGLLTFEVVGELKLMVDTV